MIAALPPACTSAPVLIWRATSRSGSVRGSALEPLRARECASVPTQPSAPARCAWRMYAIAEQRGIKVLEDCAQAHGARVLDRPVGALGHAAAYSFCQDKI